MNKKNIFIAVCILVLLWVLTYYFLLQNNKKDYNQEYIQPIWVDITSLPQNDE